MAGRRFAAIGVGSFELELGIYEIDAKYGIRNVDMLRHVIAIGSETYDTGRISYQTAQEITEDDDATEVRNGGFGSTTAK